MSKTFFQYCFELPLDESRHAEAARVLDIVHDPATDWKPLCKLDGSPLDANEVFAHARGESEQTLELALGLYRRHYEFACLLCDKDEEAKCLPLLRTKQDGPSLLVHTKWPGHLLGCPLSAAIVAIRFLQDRFGMGTVHFHWARFSYRPVADGCAGGAVLVEPHADPEKEPWRCGTATAKIDTRQWLADELRRRHPPPPPAGLPPTYLASIKRIGTDMVLDDGATVRAYGTIIDSTNFPAEDRDNEGLVPFVEEGKTVWYPDRFVADDIAIFHPPGDDGALVDFEREPSEAEMERIKSQLLKSPTVQQQGEMQ